MEGFQSGAGTLSAVTSTAQVVPGISMDGYNLDAVQVVAATLVYNGMTSGYEMPMTQFKTFNDGTAILGVDRNGLNMIKLQFTKSVTNNLQVAFVAAKTRPTATETLDTAWRDGTAGTGYSVKNLKVRIARPLGPSTRPAYLVNNPETTNPANNLIRCPPGYKFFNSADGTSMCCKGTVNPYTHQCMGATAQDDLCTFSANEKDPRPAFKGELIPECRAVTRNGNGEGANRCPPSLPYFAREVRVTSAAGAPATSVTTETCCKNPVIVSANGFTCSSEDQQSTEKYCIATGIPVVNTTDSKMERLCNEALMIESAVCPTDVTGKDVFQNVTYTMGDREAQRYDVADLKGLTLPTCYRLNEACIPEDAIKYAKSRGAFTEYDPKTWEYSCAVWSRRNRGEMVAGEVKGYLNVPLGSYTPGSS